MQQITQNYQSLCNTPSDINEHLSVLSKYASECNSVAEFGMRSVVSTWALLHGLVNPVNNSTIYKRLLSVDLNYSSRLEEVKSVAKQVNINFIFIMADDITITIEPTDLLFIDTWHIYGHLKRELEIHHSKAMKYIILHDTTVDAVLGETIRNGWNAQQQSIESGYPVEEINKGLWPAVEEFLATHPEWTLHHRYTHNNGLTILKRV